MKGKIEDYILRLLVKTKALKVVNRKSPINRYLISDIYFLGEVIQSIYWIEREQLHSKDYIWINWKDEQNEKQDQVGNRNTGIFESGN